MHTPQDHSHSQSGLSGLGRSSDITNTQASSYTAHQSCTRRPSQSTMEPNLSYHSQTHNRQRRPSHSGPSIPITSDSRYEPQASYPPPEFRPSDHGVHVHTTTAYHTSLHPETPETYLGRAHYTHAPPSQAVFPSQPTNYGPPLQPYASEPSIPSRPRRTSMENSNARRSRRSRRRPDLSDAHSDSEVEGLDPVVSRNDGPSSTYAGRNSADMYSNPYVPSPLNVPSHIHPTQGHGAPSLAPVYTPQYDQYSAQNYGHYQPYGLSHRQGYGKRQS